MERRRAGCCRFVERQRVHLHDPRCRLEVLKRTSLDGQVEHQRARRADADARLGRSARTAFETSITGTRGVPVTGNVEDDGVRHSQACRCSSRLSAPVRGFHGMNVMSRAAPPHSDRSARSRLAGSPSGSQPVARQAPSPDPRPAARDRQVISPVIGRPAHRLVPRRRQDSSGHRHPADGRPSESPPPSRARASRAWRGIRRQAYLLALARRWLTRRAPTPHHVSELPRQIMF